MSSACDTDAHARILALVHGQLTSAEQSDDKSRAFLSAGTAARYLRAYKTEAKAAKNVLATYRYRRLVHADDLGVSEATFRTVWDELKKRSMFLAALSDADHPPSPVLILRKKADAFHRPDFEDFRRAFFFTLDCAARLADRGLGDAAAQQGQWVIVMDMQGYSSKNSPPIAVSLETMRIFQNHFPERAKRIVVLDAPRAFSVLWRVVRNMIDPVTRAKFLFTSRAIGEEALGEQVGAAVLECINMDLETGKGASAKMMVDAGFLIAPDC